MRTLKEKKDGLTVRVMEEYFKEGMRYSDFGGGMKVPKFKRPLESYTKALAKAGFVISDLIEPRPIPSAKDVDLHYSEAMRLPEVLTMKIVK